MHSKASCSNISYRSSDAKLTGDIPQMKEVIIPKKYMQLGEEIPTQDLKNIYDQSEIEVLVVEIYSPSHIWLHQLGDENRHLHMIMTEINQYYEDHGEGASLRLPSVAVCKGYYCCAIYEGAWYRSKIVRVLDFVHVKVLHVDYGSVDMLPIWQLRPMLSEWGKLPIQAIRARLSGIKPKYDCKTWETEIVSLLYHMVEKESIKANLIHLEETTGVFRVVLLYTGKSGKHACINWQLKDLGKVDHERDKLKQKSYQLPDFYALENALTPTYNEIRKLESAGIDLKDIPDYVEYCLENCSSTIAPKPPTTQPPLLCITQEDIQKFWSILSIDNIAGYLYIKEKVATTLSDLTDPNEKRRLEN